MRVNKEKFKGMAVLFLGLSAMAILAVGAIYAEDLGTRLISLAMMLSLAALQINGNSVFRVNKNA